MVVYEKHLMSDPRLPFIFNVTKLKPTDSFFWEGSGNWHENIEIIYVESGSGYVVIDDIHIKANAGDIIPISANKFHGMYVSEQEMIYYYLIVERNFFLSNHFDSNHFLFDAPIRDDRAEELIIAFKKAWYSTKEEKPMRIQYLRSHALELALILCDRYATHTKSPKSDSNLLLSIKKAIAYIKAESNRAISLDEIASFVGISKYYFAREFRRITGVSFITYLNYVRCEKAKELLLFNTMSIGEIGIACGFDNHSYFTQTFKEYSGMTPKAYRQTNLQTI